MLRVPARKYSKVSNTRSGLPELRVESPNTSSYIYQRKNIEASGLAYLDAFGHWQWPVGIARARGRWQWPLAITNGFCGF